MAEWFDDTHDPTTARPWKLFDQQWCLRFGFGFAFSTKTFFVVATIMAFKQYAWVESGRVTYSLKAVAPIASSTGDVSLLLSRPCLSDNSLAVCCLNRVVSINPRRLNETPMTEISKLLPINALVIQATLTVVLSKWSHLASGNVPRINLTDLAAFTYEYYWMLSDHWPGCPTPYPLEPKSST